jgi:hypothetical protein
MFDRTTDIDKILEHLTIVVNEIKYQIIVECIKIYRAQLIRRYGLLNISNVLEQIKTNNHFLKIYAEDDTSLIRNVQKLFIAFSKLHINKTNSFIYVLWINESNR